MSRITGRPSSWSTKNRQATSARHVSVDLTLRSGEHLRSPLRTSLINHEPIDHTGGKCRCSLLWHPSILSDNGLHHADCQHGETAWNLRLRRDNLYCICGRHNIDTHGCEVNAALADICFR